MSIGDELEACPTWAADLHETVALYDNNRAEFTPRWKHTEEHDDASLSALQHLLRKKEQVDNAQREQRAADEATKL